MATKVHALRGPVAAGTVVSDWTVIAEAPRQHGLRHLRCRCVCGTERDVFIGSLRTGKSAGCGCKGFYKRRTHGMSRSPERNIWNHMLARCYDERVREYKNYGGRGIQVCDRWRKSFVAFVEDVGRRPSPELTIDRINNDGNYEPGNVRWATRSQQMLNTRLSHAKRSENSRRNAMRRWHPESQVS